MKKKLTKVLAVVLALMMLVSASPMAFAATEIANGTAGEGVSWTLDSDGTLTISGNGPIVVGWYAPPWEFYNDYILNIVIEEGITMIPNTAFCYAKNCVSISIPASLETVEEGTTPFWSMNSLEKFIVDDNNPNYKSVDGILFSKNGETLVFFPQKQGATEYTIPAAVKNIAGYAFYGNVCLKKVTVPDTVTSIGECAFEVSKIEEILLGNGISEIPDVCFSKSNIKSIVIPDSVKNLDYAVFFNCGFLESLVIGSGVETVGEDILAYSSKLKTVHYNGTQEDWNEIVIDENNEHLFAKDIHFVEHKEGIAPSCKNGNSAGLYCAECDEYFTGEVIPAVKDHNFNGDHICDSCNFTCEHETAAYHQTAETHQYKCDVCGLTEKAEPHNIYSVFLDDKTCGSFCEDCGFIEGTEVPHSMTEYQEFSSDYCIKVCKHCGYGDEETGIVKHSFDNGILVPATETEAEYIKYTCVNCNHSYKEYNTEKAMVLRLYSEYEYEWDNSAILVYVNGEPVTVIKNMTGDEYDTYSLPYDENSSYVFKWINGGFSTEYGVEIYLPDSEDAVFEKIDMSEYEMLQTIFTINVADYTEVDDALAQIPDYLEYYSADSVAALVTAVKGVERMLPAGKQAEVDAMASAIENAVNALVELEDPVPNGVINMSAGNRVYINDYYYIDVPGYTYYNEDTGDEVVYEYDGKYVILETQPKDDGDEDYVHWGIYTYSNEVEFDLVNTYITGFWGNFGIYSGSDVTLNLFGANAFACYSWEIGCGAGIEIDENSKLRIKDSNGSLVAIGQDDHAGIGSAEDGDNGEITIDGGTIFALSLGDGAGIGGGYGGGAGKITINGGTIRAECLMDDGAGIGVGDDGIGGEIIINGGDITALSLYDDGAGIGGADSGYVDSITINGGNIVAGSEDAAAIGGGQEAESFGGKI
ncbi:MAG: leucine-rich repeat domain-containing protein, partial [Acutalibacteraceae bacterium]|nr:leucine-rich repeat domain-containing protein [Acutalibacteraceae bacterium]